MADNKVFIRRRQVRGSTDFSVPGTPVGNELDLLKDHVLNFRNNFRAAFPDAARYVVSDIALWNGYGSFKGLAFIFRDKTMGCEWLFSFGCATSSYSYVCPYYYIGNLNSATIGLYYKNAATTTVADPGPTTNGFGVIHFNHDYASSTYAMNFTDTAALTYGAGDYQAPASSPYSALASFMPSATGRIKSYVNETWASVLSSTFCYIYYPEKGVLSFDVSYGGNKAYFMTIVSGKLLYKSNADGGLANPADTRRDGAFVIQRSPQNSSFGVVENGAYMHNSFVRHDGTTVEVTGRPANLINDFNRTNYLSSGLVQKRKIQISVPSYIKGYLDPEIVNESFPHNDSAFLNIRLALPDSDNPMIHDHCQMTRFWKKDLPPFAAITESDLPTE